MGSVWVCHCGNHKILKDILHVPENLQIVCAVCLGYPKEIPKPPRRMEVSRIVHEERYGGFFPSLKNFPNEWEMETFMNYRENGIRAQSPTPESFRPRFPSEMKKEAGIIAKVIKEKKKVLDVMPFSGNSLFEVIRQSGMESVHAFETSTQIADFIKRKQKASDIKCDISFRFQRSGKLPYESGTFDAVTCAQKIEMLPDPDTLVSELCRVTKPGGTVVVSFWNSRSIYGLKYFVKTRIMRDTRVTSNEGPVKPISKSRVRKLLESKGFMVRSFSGVNIFPGKMESYTTSGPLNGICRIIVAEATK